jgi:hypothetical protein
VETIDLIVDPRGHDRFLKDGREPGLEKHYFAPAGAPPEHGQGYTQFYWAPDDSAWIAWPERDRVRQLAKGKRKPFPVRVATVPPVPGLRPCASSQSTDWGREVIEAEFYGKGRQAQASQ